MQQPQLLFEGKYEILAKIREGGMGTIYRVRHRLLDEIRVVKVMQPHVVADADLKRRFLEEAKTAIRLKHPNICTIYDFAADEGGTAYLVMEYIDGANLGDFLKSRGLPGVPLTMQIGHQALLALGYLHRKGVIHRDIAPDNLMLTHDEEERPVVKLIDLGIAKAVDRAMDMTGTGVFLGKLKYASPEQFGSLPAGEKLDGRSDLYGLGVVLYELLTGRRPYKGDSPAELLRAHLFSPPIPFEESDLPGRVPPELRALVLRALEKKREDRFATAEDFDREMVSLLDRYSAPQDLEITAAMLSTIRATQPAVGDNVTPSAQDRLDRHFGVQATPSPSAPPLGILPLEAPGAPADSTTAAPTENWKLESTQSMEEAVAQRTERVDPTRVSTPLAPQIAPAAQEKIQVRKPEQPPPAGAAAPLPPEEEKTKAIQPSPSPPVRTAPAAPKAEKVSTPPAPAVPKPASVTPASAMPAPAKPLPVTVTPVPAKPAPVASAPAKPAPVIPAPPKPPLATPAPAPASPAGTREPHFGVRPSRPPSRNVIFAAVAAAALVAILLLWRPWAARPVPEEQIAAAPSPEALPPAEPTAPPAPSPAPTAVPTVAPTAAPPTPRPETPDPRARELTASARASALAERREADQARAGVLVPTTYRRAREEFTAATKLAARGADADAKKSFDAASDLYRQAALAAREQATLAARELAALAARAQATRPAAPTPVRAAEVPTAIPRPTAVPAFPTVALPAETIAAAPVEKRPVSPPVLGPQNESAALDEARQVQKVVQDYAWAQTTQDEKLYSQVFPSGIANFKLTFKNFKAQNVRLEIRSVVFDGPRATVSAHETVQGKPRAGDEVRNEADITLQLEKQGGRWVIVSRR